MRIEDEIERNFSGFPEHFQLLERTVEHFRTDDRIAGLVLGGSFASSALETDYYSDIDVYIIVREHQFEPVFADRAMIAEAIGTPLFRFNADHLPGGEHDYIVLYEGPIKVDFIYLSGADFEPERKWGPFYPLIDHTGEITDVLAASADYSLPEPSEARILDMNQKFWTWCWYVFGKIERGELWEAVDGIHTIRTLALLPLLAWTSNTPEQGYRRLEETLNPGLAPKFAATLVQRDPDTLYAALQNEIDLYCDLRDEVSEAYGIQIDLEPETTIRESIDTHHHSE